MLNYILLASLLLTTSVQYRSKRLLLLYANQADNAYLLKQKQLFDADPAGLKERDLEVRTYLFNREPAEFKAKHIKAPFTIILVGKDGGEKYRTHELLPLKNLYAIIDAMPMRKQEMNRP